MARDRGLSRRALSGVGQQEGAVLHWPGQWCFVEKQAAGLGLEQGLVVEQRPGRRTRPGAQRPPVPGWVAAWGLERLSETVVRSGHQLGKLT